MRTVSGFRAPVRLLAVLALAAVAATGGMSAAATGPTNGMIAYTFQENRSTLSQASINPDGSGNRVGSPGRSQPKFSPDGNRLLVWDFNGAGAASLYVRDVDGNHERPLSPASGGVIWDAAWSPDGSRIAFMLSQGGNGADAEVWVMNADGSHQAQVTQDGFAKLPKSIDWAQTPSGSKIAYAGAGGQDPSDRCYGWQVRTINPDGTGANCVPSASHGQSLAMAVQGLAWSPDGTRIAIVAEYCGADGCNTACGSPGYCAVPGDVWMIDVGADTTTDLTTAHGMGDFHAQSVSWAPDGSALALAGNVPVKSKTVNGGIDFAGAGVYLMPPGGGPAKRITPTTTNPSVNIDAANWQRCTPGVTKTCTSTAATANSGPTSPRGKATLTATATATYARGTLTVKLTVSQPGTAQIVINDPATGTFRSRSFTTKSGANRVSVAYPLAKGVHKATVAITSAAGSLSRPVPFTVR